MAARPKNVGPYQPKNALIRSYFGTLWQATSADGDDDELAVRVIDQAKLEKGEAERIAKVAREVAGIEHESCLAIREVVHEDDLLGLVSRVPEGQALRGLLRVISIRRKLLPVEVVLAIGADLLTGVSFSHEHADKIRGAGGVGFGGLTPDSFLVCADGHARLLELGLAGALLKSWGRDGKRLGYDAPEVFEEDTPMAPQADVFTIGALMWELLANKRLFPGSSYAAVSKRMAAKAPRATKRIGGEVVPEPVADLLAKALSQTPADRFGSVAEMKQALQDCGVELASADDVKEALAALDAKKPASGSRTAGLSAKDQVPASPRRPGGPPRAKAGTPEPTGAAAPPPPRRRVPSKPDLPSGAGPKLPPRRKPAALPKMTEDSAGIVDELSMSELVDAESIDESASSLGRISVTGGEPDDEDKAASEEQDEQAPAAATASEAEQDDGAADKGEPEQGEDEDDHEDEDEAAQDDEPAEADDAKPEAAADDDDSDDDDDLDVDIDEEDEEDEDEDEEDEEDDPAGDAMPLPVFGTEDPKDDAPPPVAKFDFFATGFEADKNGDGPAVKGATAAKDEPAAAAKDARVPLDGPKEAPPDKPKKTDDAAAGLFATDVKPAQPTTSRRAMLIGIPIALVIGVVLVMTLGGDEPPETDVTKPAHSAAPPAVSSPPAPPPPEPPPPVVEQDAGAETVDASTEEADAGQEPEDAGQPPPATTTTTSPPKTYTRPPSTYRPPKKPPKKPPKDFVPPDI